MTFESKIIQFLEPIFNRNKLIFETENISDSHNRSLKTMTTKFYMKPRKSNVLTYKKCQKVEREQPNVSHA